MKKILILLITVLVLQHTQGQGLSNFFSQKEADIKYMLNQIAAWQAYIGYLEKGYQIAQKGLTFIGDLKKGEFGLHHAFFSSLETVNPSISKYAKVIDIMTYQISIVQRFKKIWKIKNMSPAEMRYLHTVYNNMSDACTKSLAELINVITDGTYQMTDNQRLIRIDHIYADMKDKYAFTQSFTSDAALLSAQRADELNEIDFLKKMN